MNLNFNFNFQNPFVIKVETVPPAALAEIHKQLTHLIMTTEEAFAKVAADSAQLKKALGEIRTNTDALLAKIEELKNTTLTPEQENIVAELGATAQSLDDVVPDAPVTQ